MRKISIEERAICLAQYIIETKDTVRSTAKKFGVSKSTVHTEVTCQNSKNKSPIIPESIEIKGVFLSTKNPVVRFRVVISYITSLIFKKYKYRFFTIFNGLLNCSMV